jgi:HEAT repeat protein
MFTDPDERDDAIDLLLKQIADPNTDVRDAVLDFVDQAVDDEELAKKIKPRVSGVIVTLIQRGENDNVRIRGIELAVKLKLADAVDPLIDCLDVNSDRLRLHAVRALGNIPNRRCLSKLLHISYAEDPCSDAAKASLKKLYERGVVAPFGPFKANVAKSMVRLHETYEKRNAEIEAMLNEMSGLPPHLRKKPKTALGKTIGALQDSDVTTRIKAAFELSLRADPAALPALVKALEDEEQQVCTAAAHAILVTGADNVRRDLLRLLVSNKWTARKSAAYVLAKVDARRAADDIALMLGRERDTLRRTYLVDALGEIGDRASAVTVVDLMHTEPGLAEACARALAKISGEDFGKDVDKWQAWVDGSGKSDP